MNPTSIKLHCKKAYCFLVLLLLSSLGTTLCAGKPGTKGDGKKEKSTKTGLIRSQRLKVYCLTSELDYTQGSEFFNDCLTRVRQEINSLRFKLYPIPVSKTDLKKKQALHNDVKKAISSKRSLEDLKRCLNSVETDWDTARKKKTKPLSKLYPLLLKIRLAEDNYLGLRLEIKSTGHLYLLEVYTQGVSESNSNKWELIYSILNENGSEEEFQHNNPDAPVCLKTFCSENFIKRFLIDQYPNPQERKNAFNELVKVTIETLRFRQLGESVVAALNGENDGNAIFNYGYQRPSTKAKCLINAWDDTGIDQVNNQIAILKSNK
ncbi:MAG: hypothetical protein Q8T08_21780, partial [Ignavibacteria bacterium]|nr:hypothetical protein [Ignavibacteria bacterium]